MPAAASTTACRPPVQVSVAVTANSTSTPALPEPAMVVLPYVAASSPATETDDPIGDRAAVRSPTPGPVDPQHEPLVSYYNKTESKAPRPAPPRRTPCRRWSTTRPAAARRASRCTSTRGRATATSSITDNGTAVSGSPFNTYSSTAKYNQPITVTGLNPLTAEHAGRDRHRHQGQRHTDSGSGAQVEIDGFQYTPATLLTTKADVTVTDTDTGCGNNEDYPPSATTPNLTTGALANPGLPYGDYTVCVDNGTNHVTVTGVTNTSFTGSNYVTAPILSSQTGYGTGKCT